MDNAADTQVVLVPHVPANIAHALVCVWAQSAPRIRAVAAERRLRAKRVEMCMGASPGGCGAVKSEGIPTQPAFLTGRDASRWRAQQGAPRERGTFATYPFAPPPQFLPPAARSLHRRQPPAICTQLCQLRTPSRFGRSERRVNSSSPIVVQRLRSRDYVYSMRRPHYAHSLRSTHSLRSLTTIKCIKCAFLPECDYLPHNSPNHSWLGRYHVPQPLGSAALDDLFACSVRVAIAQLFP